MWSWHCQYSSYASVIMTPLALWKFCDHDTPCSVRILWKFCDHVHHMTLVSMMMFCEFGPFTFLVVWQIQCFSFQLLFIISRTILGLFPYLKHLCNDIPYLISNQSWLTAFVCPSTWMVGGSFWRFHIPSHLTIFPCILNEVCLTISCFLPLDLLCKKNGLVKQFQIITSGKK